MNSIWNKLFIFGLVFTVAGILILLQQNLYHRQCTEKTQGIIGTAYQYNLPYKTITFSTTKGEEHTLPLYGSNEFPDGEAVTVSYNPNNIKRYRIAEDKFNIMRIGIICIVGGVIFMLCGYGVSIDLFTETKVSRFRRT